MGGRGDGKAMTAPRAMAFPRVLLAVFFVAACGASSDKDVPRPDRERIAVLHMAPPMRAKAADGEPIAIPEEIANADWSQNGGNATHAPGNLALGSSSPTEIWSTGIGHGSGGDRKLLSSPVVSAGILYAQDAEGRVSAYKTKDGSRLWRVDTAPPDRDGDAMGGGLSVHDKTLYVSTGFGEILALRINDGAIVWRRMLGKPIRSAPTVAEGRLFVVNIENETTMLDTRTGLVLWQHKGIAESATLMGASSPAVKGDTVVVAYSSGELFGLRIQNGRVVWGDVLAVPTKIGALPAIADIRALPVMEGGVVFSISHSGRMAAIDERRGTHIWEADLGGINTPAVVGEVVYLVTNDCELVALSKRDGAVLWSVSLQKRKDPSNRDSKKVSWFGPVMAGGRLWLTNSLGHLSSFSPQTGVAMSAVEAGDAFFLPPLVAERTLFLLDDSGELTAFR